MPSETGSHSYSFDATSVVQYARSRNRWLAMRLDTVGGLRTINTPFNPSDSAPSYRGHVFRRNNSNAASTSRCCRDEQLLEPGHHPADRGAAGVRGVRSANQDGHLGDDDAARGGDTSPGRANLQAFLLDPPTNSAPVRNGLASTSASLDATLASVGGVIGTMRFQDGSTLSDWVVPTAANFNGEAGFSPEYWGGVADTRKWPYVDQGKFINAYAPGVTDVTLVKSNYAANGFVPVAPGMGALRVHVAPENVVNGGSYPDGGTVGTSMVAFMPPADFGTLDHLFVRYYMLIGTPGTRTPADRLEVYESGIPFWTELVGKTGIQPDASNAYGGNSGGSGGNYGWQMRLFWGEVDANVGGPDEGGQYMGFHLYDYLSQNPRGHNYGNGSDKPVQFERWNDLGGILYAGRQYCIETEIKLNTIDVVAKTWRADGELRAWVDGRLTYEQTGLIFRTTDGFATLPAYNPSKLRPTAKNGITRLWMNWFHGGHTQNTVDRNIFYSGLVWARSYIGPMKP